MAQLSELERFAQRRRLLLAESECYRQLIAGQLDNLRPAATWVERGYSLVRSLRSSWPLLAAAAGFFIARKRPPSRTRGLLFRVLAKGWSVWRLAKTLALLRRRSSSEA